MMNIQTIETGYASIPLNTPFKTALRTVTDAKTIMVKVTCDNGITGWGEAPPTHVITGDSLAGIDAAINEIIKPKLCGMSLLAREQVFEELAKSAVGNTSAKLPLIWPCTTALLNMLACRCLHFWAGTSLQSKPTTRSV